MTDNKRLCDSCGLVKETMDIKGLDICFKCHEELQEDEYDDGSDDYVEEYF